LFVKQNKTNQNKPKQTKQNQTNPNQNKNNHIVDYVYLFDDLNLKLIINNIKIAKNYINYSYLIIYNL
jgi:hypothetical protein